MTVWPAPRRRRAAAPTAAAFLAAAAALVLGAAPHAAHAQPLPSECIAFGVNCPDQPAAAPEPASAPQTETETEPETETETETALEPETAPGQPGDGTIAAALPRLAAIAQEEAREPFRSGPLEAFLGPQGDSLVIPDAFARSDMGLARSRGQIKRVAEALAQMMARAPGLTATFDVHAGAGSIQQRTIRPSPFCAPPNTTMDLAQCRRLALERLLNDVDGLDAARWSVSAQGERGNQCAQGGAACDDRARRADRRIILRLNGN